MPSPGTGSRPSDVRSIPGLLATIRSLCRRTNMRRRDGGGAWSLGLWACTATTAIATCRVRPFGVFGASAGSSSSGEMVAVTMAETSFFRRRTLLNAPGRSSLRRPHRRPAVFDFRCEVSHVCRHHAEVPDLLSIPLPYGQSDRGHLAPSSSRVVASRARGNLHQDNRIH